MSRLPGPAAELGGRIVVDGATVAVVVDVVLAEVDVEVGEDACFEDSAHAPAISVIAPRRQAITAIRDPLRLMDPR